MEPRFRAAPDQDTQVCVTLDEFRVATLRRSILVRALPVGAVPAVKTKPQSPGRIQDPGSRVL